MSETLTPFIADGDKIATTDAKNGDLFIEGFACRFSGTDRENEQFAPEAFAAIANAPKRPSGLPLLFHHDRKTVIGEVLTLRVVPNEGVWLRARVDAQPVTSALRPVFDAIKRGTIRSLSLGGLFRRALRDGGQKIVHADLTECSATAVPVFTGGATFTVVEGKALGPGADAAASIEALAGLSAMQSAAQIAQLEAGFTRAHGSLARLRGQAELAELRASIAS